VNPLTKVRVASTRAQLALENRNYEIRVAYASGETLQAIADVAGLSRQRVHQIVRS